MTTTDELKDKFNKLMDEERIAFMKSVMPSYCKIFSKNPQKMMAEMMPLCGEMMKSCNMDAGYDENDGHDGWYDGQEIAPEYLFIRFRVSTQSI